MLHAKLEVGRLHLTEDLRAGDRVALPSPDRLKSTLFLVEPRRFPPIDDVLAAVERTASRVFTA